MKKKSFEQENEQYFGPHYQSMGQHPSQPQRGNGQSQRDEQPNGHSGKNNGQSAVQRETTNKLTFRIVCISLAVVFVVLAFLVGYAVYYFVQDPAERTLKWVKDVVRTQYYYEFEDDVLANATLDDLFGSGENRLMDIYSDYYTAEEYRLQVQEYQGGRSGIGISLSYEGSFPQLYDVAGNSPAEKSGLKAGTYILGYGNNSANVVPYITRESFEAFIAERADGERFVLRMGVETTDAGVDYQVYKAVYEENYVFYADNSLSAYFTGERADELQKTAGGRSYLPNDTAYIRLSLFMGDAGKQFGKIMDVFAERGKTDLILDLRNNGGGLNTVLCEIAQYLCKGAKSGDFTVVSAKYRNGTIERYNAGKNLYSKYFSAQSKITVLANINTASASEALIGSMIDYDSIEYNDIYLAEIDGVARSYGKGIMQSTFPNLLTGEAVKLTTATVRWPVSDNCIHDVGVVPADGAIALPMTSYVEYNDSMLLNLVQNYLS